MNTEQQYRILVVDDEPSVRESTLFLLTHAGYKGDTAEDGFDALLQLERGLYAAIISDLNMPRMSGFEFLSVVRRRFPNMPVIAVSGAFQSGETVPDGVIADAFYAKGHHNPKELLDMVAALIATPPERVVANHCALSAPVWIPRNGKDSSGVPFIVITCTRCLRSFPLSVKNEGVQEIQETPCMFCAKPVRCIIDFSLAVFSPGKAAAAGSATATHRGEK